MDVFGFYKQTHWRPGDGLFLLWVPPFMTVDGLKMVHFGPKLAKLGRLVSIPKWPKRVQMGPKLSTQVFLFIWTAIY